MAHAPAIHGEHEPTTTGLNHRKLLMWAFLGSDCMFFGTLIATYLVYKNKSLEGPLPIDVFDIPVTSVSTFVLLMSSMSMVMAYAWLTRGNLKAFRIWLASTAIMGATFLAFQVYEFYEFANHGHLTPRTNLFGSHVLHPHGVPRGARDARRGMAAVNSVPFVQGGRSHAGEESGRGPGRAVLALR